jgi:hypothetical protein
MKTFITVFAFSVLLMSILTIIYINRDVLQNNTTIPTMEFSDINNRFKSENGVIVNISGYSDNTGKTTTDQRKNKIYLENIAKQTEYDNKVSVIDLTILNDQLPINLYARNPYDVTIGVILDTQVLIDMGILRCANQQDDGSIARGCHDYDEKNVCIDGDGKQCECKNNGKCSDQADYMSILAGCGEKANSRYGCNQVHWCGINTGDTNSELVRKFGDGTYKSGDCMFKVVDDSNQKINQTFIKAARAAKIFKDPSQENPFEGFYTENEIDASLYVNDKTKNEWLKAIIGVFHDSDSGYMCACKCTPETDKSDGCCMNGDLEETKSCQEKNCNLTKCKKNSIQCVKDMVSEYNKNVAKITGHKIKGWSMKNMNRHSWIGWENGPDPVDLSKFLVEI